MAAHRWQLNNSTGGLWNTPANWDGGVPNGLGEQAYFDITDAALSGGGAGIRTIDLAGTTRAVSFLYILGDAERNWDIANGTLVMQPNGGDTFLEYASVNPSGESSMAEISATLQLNAGLDVFISGPNDSLQLGDITEFGDSRTLEKFGAGTLILNGVGGYSSLTFISVGTIQIGNGGTTGGFGSGDIVNNGTIDFNRSDAYTVGNAISGNGDVAVNDGVVTLSGANTYTNFTIVNDSATLKLGNVDALGGGSKITVFEGGTLDFNGIQAIGADTGAFFDRFFNQFDAVTTGVIANTGAATVALILNINSDRVFAGDLRGNLILFKDGAGTLFLTGDSVGTESLDGVLAISQGTVALLGAGNAYFDTSLGNGGTLDLSGVTDGGAIVRDLSGTGSGRVVLGGKQLIVDDANEFLQLDAFLQGQAPRFVATAGQVDQLLVRVSEDFSETANLTASNLTLLGWEDGVDMLTIEATSGDDAITGSKFSETIYGARDGMGTGNDALDGSFGDDRLYGGIGNDTLTGGLGDDSLYGGADIDTASYEFLASSGNGLGVTASLLIDNVAQNTRIAGLDTFFSIENLTGSRNGDTLIGDEKVNILRGLAGNDTLEGGALGDTLNPGTGIDTVSYAGSNAGVTVDISPTVLSASGGHATGDTLLAGFDNITGSGFDDTLTGDGGANVILGGNGSDRITASSGNDTLNGGAGNDVIRGDGGADRITGGAGNDIFYFFKPTDGADTITDFSNVGGNNDIFRIKGAEFGGLAAGALAADQFVANTSGFATTVDQRFVYETDTGQLWYDADGTGTAARVLLAELSGAPLITIADFIVI